MKTFKILSLAFLMTFCLAVFPKTDPVPDPVLEKGDVEKLIKTWPYLKKDFKKFGMKMDTKEGNVTLPEAYRTGQEYLSILKKHGWDEHFWQKFTVILQGYSLFEYKKGEKEADSSMSKSMKELENNPHISDAMKKELMEKMKMVKNAMGQQGTILKKNINPRDLEYIKLKLKKIKNVLDKDRNDSE